MSKVRSKWSLFHLREPHLVFCTNTSSGRYKYNSIAQIAKYNLTTNRNNFSQNNDCFTCGSLILLFSAASKLSRSHDNDQTMIRDRMIRPRSSQDHHDLLFEDQITSCTITRTTLPTLSPQCHGNPHWSHFSSSCSWTRTPARPPPAEPNGQLLDLAQTSDHRRQRCAYIYSHTYMYIHNTVYIHTQHTHTQRHSFIKARIYTKTRRHKYTQTCTSKHWRHSCAIENIYSHTYIHKDMLT